MSTDPSKTILNLLSGGKRALGRSILITGPWGCGKTYLWKTHIAKQVGRPVIYISAFGSANSAELKGRLLAHLAVGLISRVPVQKAVGGKVSEFWSKLKDKSGRGGTAIASSLSSIGASFLRRSDIDPVELADLLAPDTIVCIDDIERVSPSFKMEDLLGMANILSEHKGFDVVLICNEEHIRSDVVRADGYLKFKEKAIACEFHLTGEPVAAFERIVEACVGVDARERVNSAKPTILEVFERSRTENLRLLSRVCTTLDALASAGIRELTQSEVRFLTALIVFLGVSPPPRDEFFELNAFAVRVGATAAARRSEGSNDEAAMQARFLETYFGDSQYAFHPGIFAMVRRGRIDPKKFEVVVEPEPTALKRTLSSMADADWRFSSDVRVGEIFDTLVGHLKESEAESARDLLECLAYARFFGSILDRQIPADLSTSVGEALERFANGFDGTVVEGWKMYMTDFAPYFEKELDQFELVESKAVEGQIEAALRRHLDVKDVSGLVGMLSASDFSPIKVLFERVGVEAVLSLRTTDRKMFAVVVQLLRKRGQLWGGIWPPGAAHVATLTARLNSIGADPEEDRMMRRLVKQLLA